MITQSLTRRELPAELGYLTVIGVEPIYACLADHKLLPDCQAEMWDGLWNTTTRIFAYPAVLGVGSDEPRVVDVHVDIFDDGKRFATTVMINRDSDLLAKAMAVLQRGMAGLNPVRSVIRPGMERIAIPGGNLLVREQFDRALRAAIEIIEKNGLELLTGDSAENTYTAGVGADPFLDSINRGTANPPESPSLDC